MYSNKSAGLTIVEVLVALSILSISIIIMSYVTATFADLRISQNRGVAVNFARSYTDSVKALWSNNRGATSLYSGTTAAIIASTLPTLKSPSGYTYTVSVKHAISLVELFTCTGTTTTTTCASAAGATTANLAFGQRLISVNVKAMDNRVITMSTKITRADLPFIL